ncbi:hypothetical protein RB195_015496 [Necator americanus]|uniref:Uncharacterized protein n=1 Tax=Necator americanus TaxID=51031 RepID=A0ABR1E5C2_NECAM
MRATASGDNTSRRLSQINQISQNLELFGTLRSTRCVALRPVLLSFKIRFQEKNRGVRLQPKIDTAGLKDEECRTKLFYSSLFMLECEPGRSLAMRVPSQSASRTLQGKHSRFCCRGRSLPLHLRKQNPGTILSVSRAVLVTSTRKSVLEGGCVVNCNKTAITSGRQERWSLKRRGRTSTLLNRQTPSAPELEHVHRPTYAVNEEPPTESEVLVCIQKMKNGKFGEDDRISAEMRMDMDRRKDTWLVETRYHNSPPQDVIRHGL